MFPLPLKELIFYILFVVTEASVVPCVKSGNVHLPRCSLLFIFGPLDKQKYSEKSENIIGIDSIF